MRIATISMDFPYMAENIFYSEQLKIIVLKCEISKRKPSSWMPFRFNWLQ